MNVFSAASWSKRCCQMSLTYCISAVRPNKNIYFTTSLTIIEVKNDFTARLEIKCPRQPGPLQYCQIWRILRQNSTLQLSLLPPNRRTSITSTALWATPLLERPGGPLIVVVWANATQNLSVKIRLWQHRFQELSLWRKKAPKLHSSVFRFFFLSFFL